MLICNRTAASDLRTPAHAKHHATAPQERPARPADQAACHLGPAAGSWWQASVHNRDGARQQARRRAEIDRAAGRYVSPSKQTVAQYMEQWLATVSQHIRPATYYSYEMQVRVHILPHLGAGAPCQPGSPIAPGMVGYVVSAAGERHDPLAPLRRIRLLGAWHRTRRGSPAGAPACEPCEPDTTAQAEPEEGGVPHLRAGTGN